MTPEERARIELMKQGGQNLDELHIRGLARIIREAENDALERAAKAIEAEHDFDQNDDGLTSTVEWCLGEIRALKHPTSS